MRKINDTVALDLDGTLVDNLPYEVYEKNDVIRLAGVQGRPHVVAYAKRLQQMGANLVVVTGRHIQFEDLTKNTVRALGLGDLPVYMRTSTLFNLETAVKEKAEHLVHTGAKMMVGDRDDLDGAAARMANIAYVDCNKLEQDLVFQ